MKKIIALIMILMTMQSHATTMCAANDTVAVVLDPSISITNYNYDAASGTWSAWSTQGTVYGISACLNVRASIEGETVARLTDTNNDGETKLVVGTENYGRYCWCRLTHPVSSRWTYSDDRTYNVLCVSGCASACVNKLRGQVSFRRGLFGSVAQ